MSQDNLREDFNHDINYREYSINKNNINYILGIEVTKEYKVNFILSELNDAINYYYKNTTKLKLLMDKLNIKISDYLINDLIFNIFDKLYNNKKIIIFKGDEDNFNLIIENDFDNSKYEIILNKQEVNINDKIKILNKDIKNIKNKDINNIYLYINKKENEIKDRINQRDILFKEMNDKFLSEYKEFNKRIINEINDLKRGINDNLNIKELNNLILFKKVLLSNKDKDINKTEEDLNIKIHETILDMSNKGILKNIELLDFIESDIYFNDKKYESLIYRPLYVFNSIDLETIDDNFFKKWSKINLFEKYAFDPVISQTIIINKIKHMKDLGKLLRLFNSNNKKLFDKRPFLLIADKFKDLVKTYTKEECPNFIQDTSLLIQKIDEYNENAKIFIKDIIQKEIKESKIIDDICLNLISNYSYYISGDVIEYVFNYFLLSNKILILLSKLPSSNIRSNMNSFSLYETTFEESEELIHYLNTTIFYLGQIISLDLKNGEIKYKIITLYEKKSQEEEILNRKDEISLFNLNNIDKIQRILNLLKKIENRGCLENILISIINHHKKIIFSLNNNPFNSYEECIIYLNNILCKINENQIYYYKNSELIRFIYGKQFNMFNNYLKNISTISLSPFLKYLTNDIIGPSNNLDEIEYQYKKDLNKYEYLCLLENIKKFLNNFLNEQGITLENIYQQNIIQEKYKNEFIGLYTYLLQDDKIGEIQKGVEEHILNWYYFLTDHPPMAQTLLLCNEETTSEEITAFIYRAILCQYHAVFMVGKIELLTPEKRQTLTGLINTLFIGHENEMKSCLAFVYSDKTSTIVEYLERIKGRKKLEHKDKNQNKEILYDQHVEIIYSDKSGVGKSTYIKQKAQEENKMYIHFPFGGKFNRNDVYNKLKKLDKGLRDKGEKKKIIHLDLYDSKQIDLMKEFFYSFLITKLYGHNGRLFYLSKDIEIKIEIPNGLFDFFLRYPILSMFKNKIKMTIGNLPPLMVSQDINSNIQIVCNYLKILKNGKLEKKDLYIPNISLNINSNESIKVNTKMNAVVLSQKECEELIKEVLKKNNPNYYQINSFINILSGQLKRFSMNYHLSAGYLTNIDYCLKKNLAKMRIKIVNGFILISKYLTFGVGVSEQLLYAQRDTYKIGIEKGLYDEIMQDEQNQTIISFDQIESSFVFFHEDDAENFT